MKKNEHRNDNAKRILKSAGYAGGAGNQDNEDSEYSDPHDKKLAKALDEPKTKKAGYVNGGAPKKRLDKPSRVAQPVQLARGGAAKKKEGKTQVNVIIAGKGNQQQPMPAPVPVPAAGGAPMPPRPMPPMPPAGGSPMGGPPGMPPRPGMKKGGAVKMTAGAGGGLGRLEKAKEYGGKPRKDGGKC